jgi:hypothetical protein
MRHKSGAAATATYGIAFTPMKGILRLRLSPDLKESLKDDYVARCASDSLVSVLADDRMLTKHGVQKRKPIPIITVANYREGVPRRHTV